MRKIICIFLIIIIVSTVFAEHRNFRHKKQDKEKISLYAEGYMDGAEIVKIKKDCMFFILFFLTGPYEKFFQEDVDLRLCKKSDIEYIQGFRKGYNDKAKILRRKEQAVMIGIVYTIIGIIMCYNYYQLFRIF